MMMQPLKECTLQIEAVLIWHGFAIGLQTLANICFRFGIFYSFHLQEKIELISF